MDNKGALKILNCCGDFSFSLNGINAKSVIGEADVDKVKRLAIAALEEQVASDEESFKNMTLLGLIFLGYMQGLVKLIISPHGDGIVCQIGEHWFYFDGSNAEQYDSVEEYVKDIPETTIIETIVSVLSEFRNEESMTFMDEYLYYFYYLIENLSRTYIFNSNSSEHLKYNSTTVKIIRSLTTKECDVADVGVMFRARFEDGSVHDVFLDELESIK